MQFQVTSRGPRQLSNCTKWRFLGPTPNDRVTVNDSLALSHQASWWQRSIVWPSYSMALSGKGKREGWERYCLISLSKVSHLIMWEYRYKIDFGQNPTCHTAQESILYRPHAVNDTALCVHVFTLQSLVSRCTVDEIHLVPILTEWPKYERNIRCIDLVPLHLSLTLDTCTCKSWLHVWTKTLSKKNSSRMGESPYYSAIHPVGVCHQRKPNLIRTHPATNSPATRHDGASIIIIKEMQYIWRSVKHLFYRWTGCRVRQRIGWFSQLEEQRYSAM